MKIRSTLITSFSIIVLTLLSAGMGAANPDSVGTLSLTDDILQSRAAFAVVDEKIARHLNLGVLTEWDFQKLRGPVLLKIRTEIHFQLRQEFDRIVNTVDFGAGSDSGSLSHSPSTPQVNKPILHEKASEIIRNFIAQKYISVIIRSNALIGIGEASTIRRLEGEVRYIYEIINGACISVPIKNLSALVRLPFITQIWPNAEGNLKLHDSVPHIGADKVHKAPPSGPGVTGEGVRVAVVDGGIDYTHSEFKDRIVDARGKVEVGPIGRISRGGDLDHGTHVAGIIGAADNSIGVTGVAPKVQFLDARLSSELSIENRIDALFNGLGWEYGEAIDGIEWAVKQNADVINLSMGWDPWMLGRDGKDMMSELIDQIVDDGIVFVTSAGNEGKKRDSGSILSKQKLSHIFEFDWDFEWDFLGITVPFGLDHFTVTLVWDPKSTNNDLDLVILDSTGNELVASRGYDWLVKHPTKRGTAVYEQVKVHKGGLKEKTVQYELKVEARNVQDSQDYEVWVSEDGVDFKVGSNVADPEETVSVPGYSEKVITVGAIYDENPGNVLQNVAPYFSSHGPSDTNLIKPEIVAPGFSINSTINGGGTKESSGTSMAAPHVAGVAALILDAVGKNKNGEWNFSPDDVKSAIVRGAERGGNSNIPPRPDNTYGAGLVKADNVIFGDTVPAQGELRFEITPQLLGSRFDGNFLNAENTYPAESGDFINAAISWVDSKHNLDIVLSDANGKVLGTSDQAPSNYERISERISPLSGPSYYLTVSNRSDKDVNFTGAATHPIKPATRSIPIVFESTSLADIALIIDSSGSMGGNDPKNLRKSGAKLFIESADPKVQIAIIDFDGSAETFAPLTFADDIGKNRLKSAVDRVDADGGTDIDAGLQQGFQELSASTSTAKKAAVLLTDGQDPVAQHVISNYTSRGWPIYTIGLGSSVDRRELERIAQATRGEYFEASHDYHIQTVYSVILAKTTGQSTLASYAGYINKGQQITRKVLIDNTVEQANISCTWQGSTIELVLIDPDGTQITPRDAAANPRINYKPAATYAIYTLENPKVGNWQIQATGTDIPPQGEPFNLTVSATSDFFTSLLSFDSSYTVGETIRIGIEVKEKTGDTSAAVLGATTSAKVVRPDGRVDTLNLYDDGSHNDRAVNDGVYANNYRSVDKQGTYLIKVSAENGFSREIQEQVVVGRIDNVLIDGSTLTPTAGAALKQAPSVISAVISGPAGRINANSIVLKVDGNTVSHTYDSINQLVSYRPGGLSSGEHSVQLSVRDTSGNAIETTWAFRTQVADALTERTTLTGHTHIVYSVAFSLDGQTLASGSGDNTIRLWDVNTGTEIKKLIGHTGSVNSVAFSLDGQTLASGSGDDTLRLWDVNTGTEIKKLIGHTGYVWDVTFSPDGQTIVSTSADKTVRLWDVATGTHETLTGHTDEVSSLSFSPDGQTIAGGSWDGTVRLWDVNTGTQRKILIGHKGLVWDVSFSPDGQTLASGSGDRTLHLWSVTTGIQHQILTGHTQGVYSVAFSPDGQTLASGSGDRTLHLWNVTTGAQRQTLTGHTDTVLSVAFSSDGQTLASGGNDNTIRLWGAAPDVQPTALAADVNGDGVVDIQDMKLVRANLGKYGQNDADVNGDGIVDAEDIVLVLAAIEAAGGAPARHTQVSHLFTAEEIQQWLTEARQFTDKSSAHRRGVLLLEQLLTLLTPEKTVLLPNYPNPFNPETWIPYRLATPAEVTLTIYAVNGQVVRTLDLGHQAAGFYEGRSRAAHWDGRNAQGESVASGVYFYTLKAGAFSATRKMLIRK